MEGVWESDRCMSVTHTRGDFLPKRLTTKAKHVQRPRFATRSCSWKLVTGDVCFLLFTLCCVVLAAHVERTLSLSLTSSRKQLQRPLVATTPRAHMNPSSSPGNVISSNRSIFFIHSIFTSGHVSCSLS